MIDASDTAIACASGGFRGAFVHGVLSALEERGIRVGAYAGVSSSAPPAAAAAAGLASEVGIGHWLALLEIQAQSGGDMSPVLLHAIDALMPAVRDRLFTPDAARLLVGACAVTTPDAAYETQGDGARKLGRKLLVAAARGDRDWIDGNLEPALFDSAGRAGPSLTPANLAAALYASTRMLHAWSVQAAVDGRPFVDGSYRLTCPAVELAAAGYRRVIAIGTDCGPIPLDIIGDRHVPQRVGNVPIDVVVSDMDPAELGVDVLKASADGLAALYEHGRGKGAALFP